MDQYCFKISGDLSDPEKIKVHLNKLYRKPKFGELAFQKDDKLPFISIFSAKNSEICIKMTSRAKKNLERIKGINKKITATDLKVSAETVLEKPTQTVLEQCEWWDETCSPSKAGGIGSQKWSNLEHNGPYFTHLVEPYEPHGAPLIYDKKKYKLPPEIERIANFYAQRIISEASGNVSQIWTKDKVFNKNFWTDFRPYLSPELKATFKDFGQVDFSAIVKKLTDLKEATKKLSAKEKEAKKVRTAERKQEYGFAVINNIKEPLGNFVIEPAAIFYGRGENPKRGKIKRDI